MDFEIGSGLQNTTTEGIFQIRLGQAPLTAGTGISTLLPFSTALSATESSLYTSSLLAISLGRSSRSTLNSTLGPTNVNVGLTSRTLPSNSHVSGRNHLSTGYSVTYCSTGSCALGSNDSYPLSSATTTVGLRPSFPSITSSLGRSYISFSPPPTKSHPLSLASFSGTSMATGCSAGFCAPVANSSRDPLRILTPTSNIIILSTGISRSRIGDFNILSLDSSSQAKSVQTTKAEANSTLLATLTNPSPKPSSILNTSITSASSGSISGAAGASINGTLRLPKSTSTDSGSNGKHVISAFICD